MRPVTASSYRRHAGIRHRAHWRNGHGDSGSSDRDPARRRVEQQEHGEFETIVIGGGQAGLAVGYYLKKRSRSFVILDANDRDRRILAHSNLEFAAPLHPGSLRRVARLGYPGPGWSYPTARELADYLEAYALRFELPVRSATASEASREGRRALCGGLRRTPLRSRQCGRRDRLLRDAVGTGLRVELDPRIVQMHSSEYRDPSQLRPGGVLLVGAGNSGADIGMEVSATHRTWLSGRDKGQIPFRIEHPLRRVVLPVLWFVASHVLTMKTPLGRKVARTSRGGAPRIRVKSQDLAAAGVERVSKTVDADRRLASARGRTRQRMSQTSSGARASGRTSAGSRSRSSATTRQPMHERGVASERASTSSASTSCTRSRRRTRRRRMGGCAPHRQAHRFG